jgi:hypothetical protein
VAVGGEWGGASTLAVEHAPPEKRGRYAAMPQIGSPVGTLLSSGAFLLVALLPPDDFDSWGWRIPFLAAFPLLGVALWLRRRVEESPLFDRLLAEDARASAPVREVITGAWPALLVGAGSALLGVGGFYLATTFVISYATGDLDLPRPLVLGATLVAAVVEIGVLVLGGRLAERFGAARVTVAGGIASALVALRCSGSSTPATPSRSCSAVSGDLLARLFPARLRYSGIALAANLAGIVSGFVPLVATAVLAVAGGSSWAPGLLLVGIALVTMVSGLVAPRLYVPETELTVEGVASRRG